MHRIFRDVRFSGGASDPYKTYFSSVFSRGGKKGNQACYYLHVEPDGHRWVEASVSCWFWLVTGYTFLPRLWDCLRMPRLR